MLSAINLERRRREKIRGSTCAQTSSEAKRKTLVKRLKLVEAFIEAKSRPDMDDPSRSYPSSPPSCEHARSDSTAAASRRGPQRPLSPRHQPQQQPERLIELTLRRNHRAQRKRMLQESGRTRCSTTARRGRRIHHRRQPMRPLKSTSDMLKGKQGPLPPENLLGKTA